jgi:hypothetical protein
LNAKSIEKFKPQVDWKTRWYSTFDMLAVDLKMKDSIQEFISKQGQDTFFEERSAMNLIRAQFFNKKPNV